MCADDEKITKKTYTVDEIAVILDIGRTSAYDLIKENKFKSIRIGTTIRIPIDTFNEWLYNNDD